MSWFGIVNFIQTLIMIVFLSDYQQTMHTIDEKMARP
nr:MAG TPA: hypothetical protein [Bacteriophage sp.]DAO65323.1 MAG TPA: hypothetical protein [Caudoviricetes sp.]DAQ28512.1 MAG TPA: hypothetical protein [Caudoviricetes sp.]